MTWHRTLAHARHRRLQLEPLTWLGASIVAAALIVLVAVIILLYSYPDPQPVEATGVLVALLAFLGTLLTAAVTLCGFLLKHAIEKKTHDRLMLETEIKAVSLLPSEEDEPSDRAAALVTLADLGKKDLALALLQESWPAREISSAGAVVVIDMCLKTVSESLAEQAARLLRSNAALLGDEVGNLSCPASLTHSWNASLPVRARRDLLFALVEACLFQEHCYTWTNQAVETLIRCLYAVWEVEPDPDLKRDSAHALCQLLQHYKKDESVYLDSKELRVTELTESLTQELRKSCSIEMQRLLKEADQWMADCRERRLSGFKGRRQDLSRDVSQRPDSARKPSPEQSPRQVPRSAVP